MVTSRILLLAIVAVMLPVPNAVRAQSADDLYQQALRKERTDGDLEAAIRLYQRVADGSDRALAARALVKIGDAYERLGKAGAERAYQRVVADFADQPASVRSARARLEAIRSSVTTRPRTANHALVFDDLPPLRLSQNPQFDHSPTGDRIVLRTDASGADVEQGVSLLTFSSGGAVIDTLVGPEIGVGRISPRWSPDGKYIAFLARSFVDVDPSRSALMLVPAAGGAPRVLTTAVNLQNHPATGGLIWTPDAKGISVAMRERLVTFDLQGNEVRSVPMRLSLQAQVTGYSPDGQWVAFHQRNAGTEQQNEKDVWIMPAAGGRAIQLTHAPGFDGWPAWTSDGRGIYFVSDRSGTMNIWRLAVDPVTHLPRGDAEQITTYTDAAAIYPKLIDGGKRLAFALVRETSVIHVATTDGAAPRRAVTRGQQPLLAPDGRTVYYLGQGADQPGIFAVSTAGDAARRLTTTAPPGPAAFQSYVLSPDGHAIAYFSASGDSMVLQTVATTGTPARELVRFDSREELVPAWSPSGDRLAYTRGNGLYVISAAGGAPAKIAHLYKWDGWTIRWSPDGAFVAALAWASPTEPNGVFVVPATGGEIRRLTTPAERGYKEGLEWHPDGKRLSYMYYGHDDRRDGSWVAYPDGRPTEPFVDQPTPLWDYVGVWQPDGSTYFFLSTAAIRGFDLYAYDDRTRTTRLFASRDGNSPGAGLPSFSRDGAVMAWPVTRTTRQLWMIDTSR